MDEAAATIHTEISSRPVELERLSARVTQWKIEEQALLRDGEQSVGERLVEVRRMLADGEAELAALEERVAEEKAHIERSRTLKAEMGRLRHALETAQRQGDFGRASELQHGEIPRLQRTLEEAEELLPSRAGREPLLREEVTEEEIAQVVCRWTGVPLTRLMASERDKLLHLADRLHEQVIGQQEAVSAVADAVANAVAHAFAHTGRRDAVTNAVGARVGEPLGLLDGLYVG